MHEQRKSSRVSGSENQTPETEDSKWQSAVLGVLLDAYPEPYTKGELAAAMLKVDASFPERDGFIRAVDDLVAVGLVHRNGIFLLASRAAVRFNQLGMEE